MRSGRGTSEGDGHRGGGVRPSRSRDRCDLVSQLGKEYAVVDIARTVGVDDRRRKALYDNRGSAVLNHHAPRGTASH